jgi:hypothetical protein
MNLKKTSMYIEKFCADLIPGGLSEHSKKKFDPQELSKGKKVEKEHSNDPKYSEEIAKDHLTEDPDYYNMLELMENPAALIKNPKQYKKTLTTLLKKLLEAINEDDGSKCASINNYASVFIKCAQVGSPNITIQPGKPEANCALDILKLWNPNFFMKVKEIVIGPSADYGHVESGPGKDPSVVYINADRIVAEAGQQSGKAAAIATASVIAHETAHVTSFNEEQGFVGGEDPAEQEEQKFKQWLNSGGMQRVEQLPSYQALS